MSFAQGYDFHNLLFGNGDGTFRTPVPFPQLPGNRETPLVADLDRDGTLDVATFTHGVIGGNNAVGSAYGQR